MPSSIFMNAIGKQRIQARACIFFLLCVIKWFLSHPILIFDRDLLTTTIRLINLSFLHSTNIWNIFLYIIQFGGSFVKLFTRLIKIDHLTNFAWDSLYKSFDVYKLNSHSLRHNKHWALLCVISRLFIWVSFGFNKIL